MENSDSDSLQEISHVSSGRLRWTVFFQRACAHLQDKQSLTLICIGFKQLLLHEKKTVFNIILK